MDAWIEGWADEPIPAWADDQAERDEQAGPVTAEKALVQAELIWDED